MGILSRWQWIGSGLLVILMFRSVFLRGMFGDGFVHYGGFFSISKPVRQKYLFSSGPPFFPCPRV